MAWNEPGNNNGNKDPWDTNRRRGNNGDGPPDLEQVFKNTFGKLFGGKGGGTGSGGGASGTGPNTKIVLLVVAVLIVGFYIFRGVGIVNEQERAVVLRFGKYLETKGPGLRWNPPFIDDVFTENVTRVRSWSTTEQMLTKDLNIVDIKLSVQFYIDSAEEFILKVKNPEISLEQAANSALRHVVGSTVMHEVLTEGRSQLAIEVQERLQNYLTNYTTGIRIEKVNVEDTNPPKEVQSAFDDVIRAREDEERYKNEAQAYVNDVIPNARGGAQRMVEEAMAYREEVVARATGESERFSMLLTEYNKAPEVTRQRLYLETMQDVLGNSSKVVVDVKGGNNMLYVPLDKIMESQDRVPSTTTTASRRGSASAASEMDDLATRIAEKVMEQASAVNSRRVRESR